MVIKKLLSAINVNRYLYGLVALSIFTFFYHVIFFFNKGYLPEPFVHNKSVTFMDFYYPLYWAGQEGIYLLWQSVYPPLNFLLLNCYRIVIAPNYSNALNPFEIREFIGWEILYVLMAYAILVALTIKKSFSSLFNNKKLALIFIIAILSSPSLFALERGNLIFLSLYIFALVIWSRHQASKIFWYAVLINIKPYFLIIYICELIRKDGIKDNKEFLILSPLVAILIFLLTGFVLNQEYYLIVKNLLGFASNGVVISYEILAMPTSIVAFSSLNQFIKNFFIVSTFFYILKLCLYGLIILSIIQVAKKKVSNGYLYVFIVLFLTNYSISTGGYGAIYYIPIIPILYVYKDYFLMNLIIFIILLGVWDLIPLLQIGKFNWLVYLSGTTQNVPVDLSLGSLLRPIANFLAMIIFYKTLRLRSNENF